MAVVLTNTATSSPGTALTWLAKPSSACSGWLWLQIQFSVPRLAFSAISQGAVGTMTPLASFLLTTAACAVVARLALRRDALLRVLLASGGWRPANPAAPSAESCRNWRRSMGRIRDEARRRGVGATVRWEGLHGTEFTSAPSLQLGAAR